MFQIGGVDVLYENHYEIRKILDADPNQDINISNSLSSSDKEKFIKITDIVVGNKRIRIIDSYRFLQKEEIK